MVSTMPSAVRGFTKQDAPSDGLVPAGSCRHWLALSVRYCAYISPPRTATVLPTRACAALDDPAFTTTPAPSLPSGSDWSTRPAIGRIIGSEMGAVMTGLEAVPEALA